jgi:hypothetical protein
MLFMIALMGAALAGTATFYSQTVRRANEAQLMWIGEEFRDAIALYYFRSPGTVRTYPEKLEELIEDRRYLSMQRYLRRIYRDPMTGGTQWGEIKAPNGGIMGVYSLSGASPIKRAGFADEFRHFSKAKTYREWTFIFVPPEVVGAPYGR